MVFPGPDLLGEILWATVPGFRARRGFRLKSPLKGDTIVSHASGPGIPLRWKQQGSQEVLRKARFGDRGRPKQRREPIDRSGNPSFCETQRPCCPSITSPLDRPHFEYVLSLKTSDWTIARNS